MNEREHTIAWIYHTQFTGERAEVSAKKCVADILASRRQLAKTQLNRVHSAQGFAESWYVYVAPLPKP